MQSAVQTTARLVLEQGYYSVGFRGVFSQAVYPVRPVTIVGAFCSLHLDMPLDVRVSVQAQIGFPIREFQAAAVTMPVSLFAPGVAFVGVLPFCPFAEFPEKLVIHSVEDALGGAGAVIIRPTANARVEGGDEGELVATTMGVGEFSHLFQVALLRLFARFDEGFVAAFALVFANRELSDGEPQEVKTCAADSARYFL